MHILLTGATGTLGGRLLQHLAAAGHSVLCAGRRAPAALPAGCSWQRLDMAQATPADWLPLLAGAQAVVQAVGLFRETAEASFQRLHVDAPAALFQACVTAGVPRVLHISALGADAGASTAYHRSKRAGDELLLALPLHATVLQPSLVFDAQGASSQALLALASLPVQPLPEGGRYCVQPLHVDDFCQAALALLQAPTHARPRRVALVGPQDLQLREYLAALRSGLGLPPARQPALPRALTAVVAAAGDHLPGALFDRAAWSMLQRGNVAPVHDTAALLGRLPRPASAFIPARHAAAWRGQAQWHWWQPLLRAALAFVWIWTAVVSVGVYPVQQSLQLLARSGVPPALQGPALYAAAGLDLLLGLASLHPGRQARRLWALQAGLILVYTAIITLQLPEFWAHPYGPLSKNLPMLALIGLLWTHEPPARPRQR